MIFDATCCPQDIAYPTDLNLLNDSREKADELIDILYDRDLYGDIKPRTYRKEARKEYLQTAQKKKKGKKAVRKATGKQLGYLRRDIEHINHLLDKYAAAKIKFPFDRQQKQMYDTQTHRIEHRTVSIHQPHVRPTVRGREHAFVEFGSKIHLALIDGISFIDGLSWDAFNEGSHLETYIENYKKTLRILSA